MQQKCATISLNGPDRTLYQKERNVDDVFLSIITS